MHRKHTRSSRADCSQTSTGALLSLCLLLCCPSAALANEIFSDGFESGGIDPWSSSFAADCELVMPQVTDCDLDLGLGEWIGTPAENVYAVADDSDGDSTSQALEMLVEGKTSMTLCFPRSNEEPAFLIGMVDAKIVSGSITRCDAMSFDYRNPDCSTQITFINSFLGVNSDTWRPYWMGSTSANADISSLRLTLQCEGDAVVRFDDLIRTPKMVERQ